MSNDKITVQGSAPLLQVFDMPTSIRFYCDAIGFEIIQTSWPGEDFDWCLLRLGKEEIMLNTAYEQHERPPVPEPARIAAHQDTSIYFGCPDVESAYNHISKKGIAIEKPVVTKYNWKAIFITDPDGYLLVLHWPMDQ
jgi:uncharacterized glyoxalase superfamily protein PhnB